MQVPSLWVRNAPERPVCGDCGHGLTGPCPHCGRRLLSRFASAGRTPAESCQPWQPQPRDPPSVVHGPSDILFPCSSPTSSEFTSLAEGLDPEEVWDLQSRYFQAARGVIARYGGTIEKFIGDAVMAVGVRSRPTRMTRSALFSVPWSSLTQLRDHARTDGPIAGSSAVMSGEARLTSVRRVRASLAATW